MKPIALTLAFVDDYINRRHIKDQVVLPTTEFYYGSGKGFHSDDVRGVLQSVPIEGTQLAAGRAPLLASTPCRWIEFIADFTFVKARYRENETRLKDYCGIFGGSCVVNASELIGSFGVLVDNLGRWFSVSSVPIR